MKWFWIAYAIAWASMSAAVIAGICVTGKWALLWFMVIPLFISVKTKDDEKDAKHGEE